MLTTEKVKFVFHKALLFRGTARRFLLCQFYKPYVEKQLAKRRGSCLQCGKCCDLSVKCPLLKKKNGDIRGERNCLELSPYQAMLDRQKGVCAICGGEKRL